MSLPSHHIANRGQVDWRSWTLRRMEIRLSWFLISCSPFTYILLVLSCSACFFPSFSWKTLHFSVCISVSTLLWFVPIRYFETEKTNLNLQVWSPFCHPFHRLFAQGILYEFMVNLVDKSLFKGYIMHELLLLFSSPSLPPLHGMIYS